MLSLSFESKKHRPFQIRLLTVDDTGLLLDLFGRLSRRTLCLRFMTPMPSLTQEAAWQRVLHLTHGPVTLQTALIATIEESRTEQAVALAELWQTSDAKEVAEVALLVRDDYQGEGVGTAISRQLMNMVLHSGFVKVQADILPENKGVQRLIKKLAVPHTTHTSQGETRVTANLQPFYS